MRLWSTGPPDVALSRPHRERLNEIASVFARHGLAVPLARLHVEPRPGWPLRARLLFERGFGEVPMRESWPLALRDALIELGPAFVKAGQILSVRTDLVPNELAAVLHSLQSDVPPVEYPRMRRIIERELGLTIDEAFAHFDPLPLASASIAQVYKARLHTGPLVAVKVKRPEIDEIVQRDLEILLWLAARMERHWPRMRIYRPVTAVRELQRYTLRELDFRHEGQVASRVGEHFSSWEDVVIPKVYHQSQDLLVMDFIEGYPIDDLAKIEAHGHDRHVLARTAINSLLEQILFLGLFHADPHPGNLHITPEGRLSYLDFGIFGELDERLRRLCAMVMMAIDSREFHLATRYLLRMATLDPQADTHTYRHVIEQRYSHWQRSTVSEYGFARLVYDIVTLGARHGVIYPPDVILYVKAMTTLEGVALQVVPELELAKEAAPYLEGLAARMLNPARLRRATQRSLPIWWELGERLAFEGAEWIDRRMEEPHHHHRHLRRHAPWLAGAAMASGVALMLGHAEPVWHGVSWVGMVVLGVGMGWGFKDH